MLLAACVCVCVCVRVCVEWARFIFVSVTGLALDFRVLVADCWVAGRRLALLWITGGTFAFTTPSVQRLTTSSVATFNFSCFSDDTASRGLILNVLPRQFDHLLINILFVFFPWWCVCDEKLLFIFSLRYTRSLQHCLTTIFWFVSFLFRAV